MDNDALKSAAAEVSEYMYVSKITANTVLAAWLRREGVTPNGDPWRVAKDILSTYDDFKLATDAAQQVAKLRDGSPTSTPSAASLPSLSSPPSPVSEESMMEQGVAGMASAWTPAAWRPVGDGPAVPVNNGVASPRRGSPIGSPSPFGAGAGAAIQAPRRGARAHGVLPEVVWHPKKGGIGDIEAEGLQNLLGRSALDRRQILVRETAQNSWDARLPDEPVVGFQFHLRRATPDVREVLEDLFPQKIPGLGLTEELGSEDLWLLEVSDRGTKGLGGPTRNDLAVSGDTPTDFIDFLLRVGAPRNSRMGGGTYGFGKSIAYTATQSGTMLVWTKCRLDGRLESRFLGSGIGSSYDEGKYHYTGRHWWGASSERDSVEPLLDDSADALGDALFTCPFGTGETGTSMLLIAPDLGGHGQDAAAKYAKDLAEGILWNLWPKLIPDSGRPAMDIKVFLDHEPVEIPRPEEHPILKHFVASLKSVRAQQAGRQDGVSPFTKGMEVKGALRGRGANRLYGHTAVTRFPAPDPRDLHRTPFDPSAGIRHVCLMRHDAELVVKYLKSTEDPESEAAWAGVFKPSEEHDDAFALSEPPTHDDWEPGAMSDADAKGVVSIGLRRLNLAIGDYLQPAHTEDRASETGVSMAGLGDALAGLVWGQVGSAPSPRTGTGARVKRPKKPVASVAQVVRGEESAGWQQIALRVTVSSPGPEPVRVKPRLVIATAGEGESDESAFEVLGWDDGVPDFRAHPDWTDAHILLRHGSEAWVRLNIRDGLAFDVDLEAESHE